MDDTASLDTARRSPILALFSANAVSTTGNALANVVIPWFVLETTGSAAKTGLALATAGLASVLAGFFGGPVVDKLGFKRCSVLTDLSSGIAVALVPLLYATVGLAFWQLLVLVFVGAFVDAPGYAARQSLIPRLADVARMPKERVNSALQAMRQLSDFAGPPLAGILIVTIGATGVLWINASSFVVSAAAITLGVPASQRRATPGTTSIRGYVADLKEGLGFIRRDRPIFWLVAGAVAFGFLFRPLLSVVVVVYAKQNFGEPTSLGIMLGAFGGGVLAGSLLFAAVGYRLPRRATFSLGLVAMCLPVWVLVFAPPLATSAAALALAGLANGPINPLIFSLTQERTPEELLGRVFGASFALSGAAAPLGAALAGWSLEIIGTHPVLAAIASGMLIVSLGLALNPALREMDRAKENRTS